MDSETLTELKRKIFGDKIIFCRVVLMILYMYMYHKYYAQPCTYIDFMLWCSMHIYTHSAADSTGMLLDRLLIQAA